MLICGQFALSWQASLAAEIGRVLLNVVLQVVRHFVERIDRGRGADRHAGPAVDTAFWIDKQVIDSIKARLILLRMNAVYGTCVHTECVFTAAFRDYVRHKILL
jgi:hypothetical protein